MIKINHPRYVFLFFLVFLSGCQKETSETCIRDIDGNTYAIIQIGSATWMAENLKVTKDRHGSPLETYCYNDRSDRCEEFGRLYTWEVAKVACPDGWKLPTSEDWEELEIALGMDPEEARSFGWNGTDQGAQLKEGGSSGFEALLAGYKDGIIEWDGRYFDMGYFGSFWSSTEYDSISAIAFWVHVGSDQVLKNDYDITSALSVRCIKDE